MRQTIKKVKLIFLSLTGLAVQTATGVAYATWLTPAIIGEFNLGIAFIILFFSNLARITTVIFAYDLIHYDFFGIEEIKKLQAEGFKKNSKSKKVMNLFLIWILVILDPTFGILYHHQGYNLLDGAWEILTRNPKSKKVLDFSVFWSLIIWDPIWAVLYKREGYYIYNGIPRKNWNILILSVFLNTLFIFLGVIGVLKIFFE